MDSPTLKEPRTLAIGLGANLPSLLGPPTATLVAVRPEIEKIICDWLSTSLEKQSISKENSFNLRYRWSPLFETDPIGGPPKQPLFINAVLVVDGDSLALLNPHEENAINLLERFLKLEKDFGRNRQDSKDHWGPRCLDIDLLAWGNLQIKNQFLTLPHPRLIERDFVIIPLGEALNKNTTGPRRLPPSLNWEE